MRLARLIVGTAVSRAASLAAIGAISQLLGAVSRDGAATGDDHTARAAGLSPTALRRRKPMTPLDPQPAPAEIQAAVGQTISDLGAAFSGVLVNIGRRLGLYKAMAELGVCTSEQLAQATGIRERYVREWLNNQAAGGYVRYEP